PDVRLADPRRALQHERPGAIVGATQEGADRVEFAVPADNAGDHLAPGGVAHDPVIAPPHGSAKAAPDERTESRQQQRPPCGRTSRPALRAQVPSGSKRAANVSNRLRSTMRRRTARTP